MDTLGILAHNLTLALLDGPWASRRQLVGRAAEELRGRDSWLPALVRRVLVAFPTDAPQAPALLAFLRADAGLRRAGERLAESGRVFWPRPAMMPAAGPPVSWKVPPIVSTGALAEWLGLTPRLLDWYADTWRPDGHAIDGPLHHYTYQWAGKRDGRRRLIEQPRPRLKALQRAILHGILDHIPPHDAAHGYRAGRNVVSFARPHARQEIVLRLDLRDFFPSVGIDRVRAVFRAAGYPENVAAALAGLCTHVTPAGIREQQPGLSQRFRSPHLPQGAPTSPALANLCAYRLDCRLVGLAERGGARYTRYADDLAFSGGRDFARSVRRFHVAVCVSALEEGFEVNTRKTRFLRRHAQQRLTGIVLNEGVNVPRRDYDRLKAILTNCVRLGPGSQNREGAADFRAHLLGRLAHVAQIHPAKAERLRAIFARIDWPA